MMHVASLKCQWEKMLEILYDVMPSVLWCCWLGSRKGIGPVKNWVMGCWHGYLSGARCRLAYGSADATATHSLASVKSRLVLPFWYRLTWVVPEKGPLNGCVCVMQSATIKELMALDCCDNPMEIQQLQLSKKTWFIKVLIFMSKML